MTLEILIDIDNDAFLYDDGELHRILAVVADLAIETQGARASTSLRDVNGSTVGHWQITA